MYATNGMLRQHEEAINMIGNTKIESDSSTKSNKGNDPLFSRKEAAHYLGVAPQTLAIWASTKRYNLQMTKIGRLAKYRKSALDAFAAMGTV